MTKLKTEKGFTLIELLVVIAIIGILAGIVITALGQARGRARDARRIIEIKQIQTALEMYYITANEYPLSGNPGINCAIHPYCNSTGSQPWIIPLGEYFGGRLPIDPGQNTFDSGYVYVYAAPAITPVNEYFLSVGLETPHPNLPKEAIGEWSGTTYNCRDFISSNAVDCAIFEELE